MEKRVVRDYCGRSNNLGFLKWIAAIIVIYSHSYIVTGFKMDPLEKMTKGQITFGGVSVAVFFFASGYFVAKSLERANSGKRYWIGRIGRLYPGFITVLLLTVFVLGPIVSTKTLAEYFTSPITYSYFLFAVMIPRYQLPGVFENNPLKDTVNASLWTMILEAIGYIALYMVWKLKWLNKKSMTYMCVLAFILWVLVFGLKMPALYEYHHYLRPAFIFFVGIVYYVFGDKIVLDYKIALVATALLIVLSLLGLNDFAFVVLFPYIISCFVFSTVQLPGFFGKWGDYSYMLYLVAFPIQQTLVRYNSSMSYIENCGYTIIIGMAIAVLLYYLIEEPVGKKITTGDRGKKK